MAFIKRTWLARIGTGLNKFIIGEKDANNKQILVNSPDSVSQQGDVISADNLNDLENRIDNGFDDAHTEMVNGLATKQNTLTFDNVPTSGSNNPVKSGGIYTTIEGMKLTKVWENQSPTAEFTTSTIEFNESLQEVVIEYAFSTDYPNFRSFLHIKSATQFGLNPNLGLSACNLGGITDITFWIRGVSLYYSSESNKYVVSFSSTKRLDLSTSSPYVALQNRNGYIIPIAIYKVGNIYNN